jgi:hypothetical protein
LGKQGDQSRGCWAVRLDGEGPGPGRSRATGYPVPERGSVGGIDKKAFGYSKTKMIQFLGCSQTSIFLLSIPLPHLGKFSEWCFLNFQKCLPNLTFPKGRVFRPEQPDVPVCRSPTSHVPVMACNWCCPLCLMALILGAMPE